MTPQTWQLPCALQAQATPSCQLRLLLYQPDLAACLHPLQQGDPHQPHDQQKQYLLPSTQTSSHWLHHALLLQQSQPGVVLPLLAEVVVVGAGVEVELPPPLPLLLVVLVETSHYCPILAAAPACKLQQLLPLCSTHLPTTLLLLQAHLVEEGVVGHQQVKRTSPSPQHLLLHCCLHQLLVVVVVGPDLLLAAVAQHCPGLHQQRLELS